MKDRYLNKKNKVGRPGKVSLKKGFARLANELAREIAHRDFNETQYAILFAVIPETYGFKGRESFPYSRAAMAQATGRDASHVGRAVTALVDAGVLLLEDGQLGINTQIDEWQIAIKRGAENAPSGGRKAPSASGVKRPESGRKTPDKRAENARIAALESADSAILDEPKEKKESINKPFPLKGVSQEERPKGLKAIAEGTAWGDGEQEKFLSLVNLSRLRDLGLLMGDTAEKALAYMAFSRDSRAKAWAYLEARQAAGEQINKPLGFLVKFLRDPNSYPAIAGLNAPAKVVPMRQQDSRPAWLVRLLRGRPTGTENEFLDALDSAGVWYTKQGYAGVERMTVLTWAYETNPMAAAQKLHETLIAQSTTRKDAANG